MKSLWIATLLTLGLGSATASYASSNQANVSVRVSTPEFGLRIGSGEHHHRHALPRVFVPVPVYSPRHHHFRPHGHAYGHRFGQHHRRAHFERHHAYRHYDGDRRHGRGGERRHRHGRHD
ncbi:MAG TPA: hypothetical protein PLQ67_01780 [Burkholderiaceae bacterium]|nr:hypothetical protein [Burkholderiaceae bacterium]